jgi:hypothetical protein
MAGEFKKDRYLAKRVELTKIEEKIEKEIQ